MGQGGKDHCRVLNQPKKSPSMLWQLAEAIRNQQRPADLLLTDRQNGSNPDVGCDLQSTSIVDIDRVIEESHRSQGALLDDGWLVRTIGEAVIDATAQLLPPIRSLSALAADEGALASPRGPALSQTEIAVNVKAHGAGLPLDLSNRWLTMYETEPEALGHVARQVLRI